MHKLLIFSLFIFLNAAAQDSLDLTEVVTVSKKEDAPTREQLFKDVAIKVSKQFVEQMLGESKFEKSARIISSKIYSQSDRYIPVMRNTAFELNADGAYQSSVTLKISLKDLKQLLLKEGLLSASEGIPTVATFISINDRVNSRSHRWWLPDPVGSGSSLVESNQKLLDGIKAEFNERGFFVADPQHRNLKALVPPAFLSDSYKSDDLSFLGEFLGYEIMLSGKITFNRAADSGYRISVDVQAIQSTNGQSIAEVVRQFEIKSGSFEWALQNNFGQIVSETSKELASQVQEVWQKGTLGSAFSQIIVTGDIEYKDLENFKRDVSKLSEVKILRERLFDRGSATYEVGSSVPPSRLVEKLKAAKLSYTFSTSGNNIYARKR